MHKAKEDKREDVPVSKLRVGLKCGGSDGFSGITANPLVGEFSDWLVAQGGTSILTEVPEMFGAETILMNRCENKELFDKTVHLINDFKEYFLSHGEPVGENPSPGNKAGGISTLEDKALGCTQKCGRAPVSGVLQYGDRLETTGLEPPFSSRQRPRSSHSTGFCRLPARTLHHRSWNAIRHLRTNHEDFYQQQSGKEQAKLD